MFAGSLLIDISPAFDVNSGNWIKQQNPDVQVGHALLLLPLTQDTVAAVQATEAGA